MTIKAIKTYLIILILLVCQSAVIHGQELTREEKRAQKKVVRELLKSSIKMVGEENYTEASQKLDSLLVLDNRNADGYYYRGFVSLKQGDTSAAETTIDLGISKSPMSSRLKALRARIFINKNNIDAANALLAAVFKIKPKHSESLYLKGLIYLIQADTVQALEYFDKSLGYELSDE